MYNIIPSLISDNSSGTLSRNTCLSSLMTKRKLCTSISSGQGGGGLRKNAGNNGIHATVVDLLKYPLMPLDHKLTSTEIIYGSAAQSRKVCLLCNWSYLEDLLRSTEVV